ncbi:MAG: PAS domain-containing sensor histidine kinase [Nitrospirota bacterium]
MIPTPEDNNPSSNAPQKDDHELQETNRRYATYIREKVNQLLQVIGTLPLSPEELDDDTLLDLDPIGIVAGSFEQILEYHKEIITELRMARDELQAIFDATGVGISIIDNDFRIIKCNEKQRELLVDKDMHDITGKYCYEIYCNKESPGLDCPAVDTLATGRSVIIREVEKKGKHFQIVTTPFKDGEGGDVGAIEVLLDITEKKRAEDAEKEQRGFYLTEKSKLATIIQSLSDGLFVTDKEGTVVSFNNAAQRITGYSEMEAVGMPYESFLDMLAQGTAVNAISGKDFRNTELTILTKDKQQLVFSLTSALVKDSEDRAIGKVFTFRDVTEEKQRQEVYHRTEKLVALGQLSAGIAHELNTPLGNILGYARLLMKDKNLSPLQKERLEIVAEQAKKSNAIIKDLLSFARQSNPALRNIRDVDINAIVTDVLRILRTETEKHGINVHTDLGNLPTVKADGRQIEQVILNIVLNAIQAIGDNGEIRVKTACKDGSVITEIKDSGPGIPEEVKPRIFDPFFTTKPVGKGTGLGLSICAGIVNEHGGSIDIESREGKGATFTIALPVHNS